MPSKIKAVKFLFLCLIIFSIIFTRFIKLDWGNGHFTHPDENNMAIAISSMSFQNLNPHFFAYGQFPLYLAFFSGQLINFFNTGSFSQHISFDQSIYILRFWSALFSTLAIFFLFAISKNLFKNNFSSLIFIFLLIFNPGLIQLAHFGTTESILILVFVVNIFLAQTYMASKKINYIFLASLISGIGIGSKISALILLGPIFLVLFLDFIQNKNIKNYLFFNILFLALTLFFTVLFSPYNLLDKTDFLSSMNYEMSVATGNIKVFYTNQFINSIPYFFQIKNIFPYVNGIFVSIFSIFGLIFFIKDKKLKDPNWLLIIIPAVVYFLYTGQLYTKWTRFMSPTFFIFPLLAAVFISQFKNKIILFLLTLIAIIPGMFFLNIYLHSDIRLTASEWIKQNINHQSQILSEAGNVVNLPYNNNYLNVHNFDFYNLDSDPQLISELSQYIKNSNYIFVPSRRIFKNQNNNNFIHSQNYYQQLFSGNLGFTEIKKFLIPVDLFLNSESAEETWSVFDHPTIRIFQKS